MPGVPDIKLIRTDTTLDLSQKAEKRYPQIVRVTSRLPRHVAPTNGHRAKLCFSANTTVQPCPQLTA